MTWGVRGKRGEARPHDGARPRKEKEGRVGRGLRGLAGFPAVGLGGTPPVRAVGGRTRGSGLSRGSLLGHEGKGEGPMGVEVGVVRVEAGHTGLP